MLEIVLANAFRKDLKRAKKRGQKRCAKMAVLNLSVLPLVYGKILLHEGCFERLLIFEELTEHQFRFVDLLNERHILLLQE